MRRLFMGIIIGAAATLWLTADYYQKKYIFQPVPKKNMNLEI